MQFEKYEIDTFDFSLALNFTQMAASKKYQPILSLLKKIIELDSEYALKNDYVVSNNSKNAKLLIHNFITKHFKVSFKKNKNEYDIRGIFKELFFNSKTKNVLNTLFINPFISDKEKLELEELLYTSSIFKSEEKFKLEIQRSINFKNPKLIFVNLLKLEKMGLINLDVKKVFISLNDNNNLKIKTIALRSILDQYPYYYKHLTQTHEKKEVVENIIVLMNDYFEYIKKIHSLFDLEQSELIELMAPINSILISNITKEELFLSSVHKKLEKNVLSFVEFLSDTMDRNRIKETRKVLLSALYKNIELKNISQLNFVLNPYLFLESRNISNPKYFQKVMKGFKLSSEFKKSFPINTVQSFPINTVQSFNVFDLTLKSKKIDSETSQKAIYLLQEFFKDINNSKEDILSMIEEYEPDLYNEIHPQGKLILQRKNFDFSALNGILSEYQINKDLGSLNPHEQETASSVLNTLIQNIYLMEELFKNNPSSFNFLFQQLKKINQYESMDLDLNLSFNVDNFLEMDDAFKKDYIKNIAATFATCAHNKVRNIDTLLFEMNKKEIGLIQEFEKYHTDNKIDFVFRSFELYSNFQKTFLELNKENEDMKRTISITEFQFPKLS